jgi:hypothetical protein
MALLLSIFSLLAALSPPPAQGPQPLAPAATLRWTHSNGPVHVRGSVPVPANFDIDSAWALAPSGASPIPAQLEVVTRGPGGAPEVVEVLARIPACDPPLRWADLIHSQAPPTADLPAPHAQLPAPIRLRARDAGHTLHQAAIAPGARGHIAIQPRKHGPVHRQDRHALVLLPPAGAEALHPHLFGVHAYLGNWTDAAFLTLDLRIHNGLVSPDPEPSTLEAPVGPLYFESLELVLPPGWSAILSVADPALGEPYASGDHTILPLIRPLGGDELHLLPPASRLHRRLALYPTDDAAAAKAARLHLDGAGRAICLPRADRWSWSNPETARYFPQRELLPDLSKIPAPTPSRPTSFLERLVLSDASLTTLTRTGGQGQDLLTSPAIGWAHPWFRPSAGGHGGEGVNFLEGLRALATGDPHEFRRLELLYRANASRHATAAWRADGSSTRVEEWTDENGSLPFSYHLVGHATHRRLRLPCDGGPKLTAALLAQLAPDRRPPYDASSAWKADGKRPSDRSDLLAWQPHDGAHIIRFTAHAKALAWLTNDSLAIDDLLHEAERVRLALPTIPNRAPPRTTLHQLSAYAAEQPHYGLPIGRELGWALDTTACAYSLGDDATRARLRPWLVAACRLLVQGTPATGVPIRNDHSPLSRARTHATAHSFQTAILHLGLRSASRSCLRADGADARLALSIDALLLAMVETLFHGPVFHAGPAQRSTWPARSDSSGPRWIFPVAPLDWKAPPFPAQEPLPPSGFDGGVEANYANTLLAWAHRLDPPPPNEPPRHLNRVLDLGPRYATWADWRDHLARRSKRHQGLDPLSQAAPALVLAP